MRVSGASDLIDLALEVRAESERAWLLSDGVRAAWAPKSLVENNGDGTFAMAEWLAKDKGWL